MLNRTLLTEKQLLEQVKKEFDQKQYDKVLKTFEEVYAKNAYPFASSDTNFNSLATACFEYAKILKRPYSDVVDGLKIPNQVKYMVKAGIGYRHGSPEGRADVIKNYELAINWIEKNNLEKISSVAQQ